MDTYIGMQGEEQVCGATTKLGEASSPADGGGVGRGGGELQLNLEGWGKFVEQGLRMGVFWAEGAAGGKAQR